MDYPPQYYHHFNRNNQRRSFFAETTFDPVDDEVHVQMTMNQISVLTSGFFSAAECRGEDGKSDQCLIQHPAKRIQRINDRLRQQTNSLTNLFVISNYPYTLRPPFRCT